MNQGRLDVVKQENVRVHINILGISELKWMGMGEFNSDDHCIYYCGQESLRGNEGVLRVNERVQNSVFRCNLKKTRMILAGFQSQPFNTTVIQVYTPTTKAKEAEVEWLYDDLQHLLESKSEVAQSCPTLYDSMDCSLPHSSLHGIFQARVLEWVAISFSRGSSQPRDQTQVFRNVGTRFTVWATREVLLELTSKQHLLELTSKKMSS